MLFHVGSIELDTFPAEVGKVQRDHTADFVQHALIGRRQGDEAVGPGDDVLTLSGQLVPSVIGGLSELQRAHDLCDRQEPLFVRGGTIAGYFLLLNVSDDHEDIQDGGVGFTIKYTLKLRRTGQPSQGQGADAIGRLVSLFG